jgi:hypothetical protein
MIIRCPDVGNAITVQIRNDQAGIRPTHLVTDLRLGGANAVSEEKTNVLGFGVLAWFTRKLLLESDEAWHSTCHPNRQVDSGKTPRGEVRKGRQPQ